MGATVFIVEDADDSTDTNIAVALEGVDVLINA